MISFLRLVFLPDSLSLSLHLHSQFFHLKLRTRERERAKKLKTFLIVYPAFWRHEIDFYGGGELSSWSTNENAQKNYEATPSFQCPSIMSLLIH